MTYIVTERCASSRYTDCVADCPVDCFYEIQDPHMLIINPDECIDCDACVPLCPVNAIYPEAEVPEEYEEWTPKMMPLPARTTTASQIRWVPSTELTRSKK